MAEREYEVTIGPDGKVELSIHGHKGKSCLGVAKIFEQIVGTQESQRLTSEYYEPEENVHFHIGQSH
jgi:hypothetical protein